MSGVHLEIKSADRAPLLPRKAGELSAKLTEGALSARPALADGARPLSHAAARPDRSPINGGAEAALTRAHIVAAARSWLGTPYVHQASAKGAGCDCLGLVRGLYTELYGREPETPPPYTPDWNERRPCEEPLLNAARRHLVPVIPEIAAGDYPGPHEARAPSPRGVPDSRLRRLPGRQGISHAPRFLPGQILIFRIVTTGPAKHCGVVSAHDQFIHAYAGRCVIESWLCRWWIERIAGVFEFPGVEG